MTLFARRRPPLRFAGYGAALIACFLLQAGLGPVWEGRLWLLGPLAAAVAAQEEPGPAAGFGAAAGLLWDAMGGGLFGSHALAWTMAAAGISAAMHWLRPGGGSGFLLAAGALLAESALRTGAAALLWQEPGLWYVWARESLPAVVVGGALCPAFGALLRRLSGWLCRPGKGER